MNKLHQHGPSLTQSAFWSWKGLSPFSSGHLHLHGGIAAWLLRGVSVADAGTQNCILIPQAVTLRVRAEGTHTQCITQFFVSVTKFSKESIYKEERLFRS